MKTRHFLIIAALLMPFIFRDYTPDNELRYISIADEAIQDGTWFTFHNHGEAYADKPPLYFWLVMLSRLLLGSHQMWLLGLFSILPMIGTLLLMDKWLRRERQGFDTVACDWLMATTGFFLASALVLRMDMLMTFFITLSLYTFWRLYKGIAAPREKWLLPVYIFLALFTKGPYGVMIPLASMAVFTGCFGGGLKRFGRYFGVRQLGILLALCALWFATIYWEGGSEYLDNLLFKQTIGRGVHSFHHAQPIWYYLVRLPLTLAPWSLLYLAVIGHGLFRIKEKSDLEKFFLTVIATTFVMLSLVSSKLDIYLIPIYPFVVGLSVLWLEPLRRKWYTRTAVAVPAALFILVLPAALIAKGQMPQFAGLSMSWAYLGAALLLAGGTAGLLLIKDAGRSATASAMGLTGMILAASLNLPAVNDRIGLERLTRAGAALAAEHRAEGYAFYKFRGENLDVYLGTQLSGFYTLEELKKLDASSPVLLFVRGREVRREKELERWLEGKPEVRVGDYRAVIAGHPQLKPKKNNQDTKTDE